MYKNGTMNPVGIGPCVFGEYLQQQMEAVEMRITLQPVQQAHIFNSEPLGRFDPQLWRQSGAVEPDLNFMFWSPTQITSIYSITMARTTDSAMAMAWQM